MPDPKNLMRNILTDVKVELTEMFDKNFERKGFFEKKWPARKNTDAKQKGTLLLVTGKMRRSIRSSVRGTSVVFTSAMPYTALHNEGGSFTQRVKAHARTNKKTGKSYQVKSHIRNMNMPQRQFIGDHKEVREAIGAITGENLKEYFDNLAKEIKQ